MKNQVAKKNQVTKKNFIYWFADDWDDLSVSLFNMDILGVLAKDGQITIRVEDFYDIVGYIPQRICVNRDGNEEYDPSEVELID